MVHVDAFVYAKKEMAIMQRIITSLISALLHTCKIIVMLSFWRMAFIAFLLRLFIVYPIGPLLALLTGIVWCVGNVDRILSFTQAILDRFTA